MMYSKQLFERHPEAGSSLPSWPKASQTDSEVCPARQSALYQLVRTPRAIPTPFLAAYQPRYLIHTPPHPSRSPVPGGCRVYGVSPEAWGIPRGGSVLARTLEASPPPCPYGIAYRRAWGFSRPGCSKKNFEVRCVGGARSGRCGG